MRPSVGGLVLRVIDLAGPAPKSRDGGTWTGAARQTRTDVETNSCCLLMNCRFCVCVNDPNVYMN